MQLYTYQVDGREFLLEHPKSILADDMGLGKTAQALSTCTRRKMRRGLIVTVKSMKPTWGDEIDKWLGLPYSIVDGTKADREALIVLDNYFTIINFDLLRLHTDLLASQPWDLVIFDEAHKLKNRKSKVFAAASKILKKSKPAAVHHLTGTPVLNRAEELWSLLNLLDPKVYSSYWRWVEEHMEMKKTFHAIKGGGGQLTSHLEIGGPKDPVKLRESLKDVMLRREKEDCLDLPSKTFQTVKVNLEGAQLKHYQTMRDNLYAKIREDRDEIAAPTILAQITRLKQIAVSHLLLDASLTDIEGAKIDALRDIIAGLGDQKAVVFSQFEQAISRLVPEFPQSAVFTGKHSENWRRAAMKEFQESEDTRLLFTTIQCGGQGVTLTAGSVVIFLDLYWTPGINKQAVDRVHRIGQGRPVTVYTLVADNTIEGWILKLLSEKQTLFDTVIPVDRLVQRIRLAPVA